MVLLLDFAQHPVSSNVASSSPVPPVDFEQLRLDDARALLSRDAALALPAPALSSTDYLQAVIDGLCELSLKDPLTGLANRRHFRNVLDRTIEVVARSGEPALLLMLDIDHFKKVNDTYGHGAGDVGLQTVATALGTLARYGGEEFAVILPNCHTYFGQTIAERIRQTIEQMPISVAPGVELHVTVSIGGAYAPEWVRSTGALWTERADTQLYRAKKEGRNRVSLDYQQEIVVSAEEKNMLFGHLALGDPAWIDNTAGDPPLGSALQRVN